MVGASGILAPLGELLRAQRLRTVGISRGARLHEGEWDERVALDARDLTATTRWATRSGADVAALVAYAPALSAATWPVLAGLAPRTVVVATTQHAAPGAPTPPWSGLAGTSVLQLGWTGAPRRWHTAPEVSRAVVDMLGDLPVAHRVLGTVRPWSDRPA